MAGPLWFAWIFVLRETGFTSPKQNNSFGLDRTISWILLSKPICQRFCAWAPGKIEGKKHRRCNNGVSSTISDYGGVVTKVRVCGPKTESFKGKLGLKFAGAMRLGSWVRALLIQFVFEGTWSQGNFDPAGRKKRQDWWLAIVAYFGCLIFTRRARWSGISKTSGGSPLACNTKGNMSNLPPFPFHPSDSQTWETEQIGHMSALVYEFRVLSWSEAVLRVKNKANNVPLIWDMVSSRRKQGIVI